MTSIAFYLLTNSTARSESVKKPPWRKGLVEKNESCYEEYVQSEIFQWQYFNTFFKHKKATPPRPSVKEKVFEHYVTFARMTDM